MATFNFKNLAFTDSDKAEPIFEHAYYPFEKEGDFEAKITCIYLKNSEMTSPKYTKKTSSGIDVDYQKIIEDKVVSIEGIYIEGENRTVPLTKEMLFSLPNSPAISRLIASIVTHLMDASRLTEDEEKNSGLDTNALEKDSLSKKDAQ